MKKTLITLCVAGLMLLPACCCKKGCDADRTPKKDQTTRKAEPVARTAAKAPANIVKSAGKVAETAAKAPAAAVKAVTAPVRPAK